MCVVSGYFVDGYYYFLCVILCVVFFCVEVIFVGVGIGEGGVDMIVVINM